MSYYKKFPEAPSYIAMFSYSIDDVYEEEIARRQLRKIAIRCEAFAKAVDIHFHDDFFLFDEEYHAASARFVFNIKEPKDSIFLKMPALLTFAACLKLTFINQFHYPEKFAGNS